MLHTGIVADVPMKVAHNTTVELKCTASDRNPIAPIWSMDGSFVLSGDAYRVIRDGNTDKLVGILTINGNQTCGTFRLHCTLYPSGQIMHNTTLTVEG